MNFLKLFQNKLTVSLIAAFTLVILVSTIIPSYVSISSSNRVIDDQLLRSKQNTLSQIEKNLSTFTFQVNSLINMYDLNSTFESLLSNKNDQSASSFSALRSIQQNMMNYSILYMSKAFEIAVHGISGLIIYNDKIEYNFNTSNITEKPWYHRLVKEQNSTIWTQGTEGIFKDYTTNNNYFSVARLLKNSYNNSIYGIIIIRFDEDILYDVYSDTINMNNQIFVTNDQNTVLSSNKKDSIGSDFPFYELIEADNGDVKKFNYLKHDYYGLSRKIGLSGLTIYDVTPAAELLKYSNDVKNSIMVVALCCILLVFIFSIYFTKRITFPIIELTKRVMHRCNRYNKVNDYMFTDTVTVLSKEFNTTIDDLETTINCLVREQEKKRHAQIQMLQYQISPHFLYNTLSAIKCLVWTGRTEQIESMVNCLISLLQFTVKQTDEMVTLEQDLHCINDYLTIQEIRLCCKIQLLILCEDKTLLDYKIPKLLIQPIIENAVFHGIEPAGQDGCITVKIGKLQDDLIIRISNSGTKIDDKTIDNIFKNSHASKAVHIGIKNVKERLLLYYGSEKGLNIRIDENDQTEFCLVLPFKFTQNEVSPSSV